MEENNIKRIKVKVDSKKYMLNKYILNKYMVKLVYVRVCYGCIKKYKCKWLR